MVSAYLGLFLKLTDLKNILKILKALQFLLVYTTYNRIVWKDAAVVIDVEILIGSAVETPIAITTK